MLQLSRSPCRFWNVSGCRELKVFALAATTWKVSFPCLHDGILTSSKFCSDVGFSRRHALGPFVTSVSRCWHLTYSTVIFTWLCKLLFVMSVSSHCNVGYLEDSKSRAHLSQWLTQCLVCCHCSVSLNTVADWSSSRWGSSLAKPFFNRLCGLCLCSCVCMDVWAGAHPYACGSWVSIRSLP